MRLISWNESSLNKQAPVAQLVERQIASLQNNLDYLDVPCSNHGRCFLFFFFASIPYLIFIYLSIYLS